MPTHKAVEAKGNEITKGHVRSSKEIGFYPGDKEDPLKDFK